MINFLKIFKKTEKEKTKEPEWFTEFLENINPKKHPKYSQYIYDFFKNSGRNWIYGFSFYMKDNEIYIGVPDYRFNTLLNVKIKNIKRDGYTCLTIDYIEDFTHTPEFKDKYLNLGVCSFDEHRNSRDGRFEKTDKGRCCKWCGHKQSLIVYNKTVEVKYWQDEL